MSGCGLLLCESVPGRTNGTFGAIRALRRVNSTAQLGGQMDKLRELALEVAQRILAAGTDGERYELGVENTNSPSVRDLVELAKQLLKDEGVQNKHAGHAA